MNAFLSAALLGLFAIVGSSHAATTLYSQNFENPTGFVNDGGDVNIFRSVNQLYGNQPPGFSFAQDFTVETLIVGGTQAHGQGFKDPQGIGGQYVLGLLSNVQNDLLGLAFNVGSNRFLNLRVDVSSIDLSTFGGPFVSVGGAAPAFRFSLYDNPGGGNGVGSGTPLSFADAAGVAGPNKFTFDWRNIVAGLDATGNTNGNVILRVDLLSGGYAAFDNLVVASSDIQGEVPTVPEPGTWLLMLGGLAAVVGARRRSELLVREQGVPS